jgi:hypothetical protein
MNTNQLQAALRAAQETVKHLTELIEEQEPEAKTIEAFNIYPLDKEHYPEVKRVLEGLGYGLFGEEWLPKDDCVATTGDGSYMTHKYSQVKDLAEPTYTFTEFMTKYSK